MFRNSSPLVQLYIGLYYIPWIMKPIWGLLTDVFPIRGYRRRPYFVVAGILGGASALMVAVIAGMAIADVTIDACIARNSIVVRSLAPDIQSLCGFSFCSSAGALIGYSTSGFFVHHLGPQGALILLAMPPVFITVLGLVIYEMKSSSLNYEKQKLDGHHILNWCNGFNGGVVIYNKTLKGLPFRNLLFFAQLLYGTSGMLDLIFILRWNLAVGIPDYFFVITEECVSRIISRIRWIPMMVLSTRLCPIGIEGTFFALLMCIDSLGFLTSKWGGGMVLHMFHVSSTDFTNLWMVILIRNILRIATLGLIFLVPKADQSDALIPPDILTMNSTVVPDDEGLELVPENERDEV
ncbi:putative folate-biopterin transporter 6 [Hibiscus syriacus]|uniref:Folate-biopterin transporter 6 n=1 Tax=Hibiscus syriacus TaxID=106335 RepID=A0A6A2YT30_HIBSY|nr:putative folate-biopterin transporter 6 [Hibiscus syriacus]